MTPSETTEQHMNQNSQRLEQTLQTLNALISVMSPELLRATLFEMKSQGNHTASCLWLSLQEQKGN